MDKIVISGYYGFGNSGDEAILKTIIRDLRELHSDIKITVLSINPKATKQLHGVTAIYRYNVFQVISCLMTCDIFISGGGSLLQDMTSTRSLLYYLYLIRLALSFNKKVMLYANGIGPINNLQNREKVKNIIDKVDVITFRDESSYQLIKEIGVTTPKLKVTADPVLTINYSNDAKAAALLKEENIPQSDKLVAINLREWFGIESLEQEMVKAIDYMQDKYSFIPVFIPMSATDRDISERVCNKIKGKYYILQKDYQPEDLIGMIAQMQLVIAMRLHTLIYASINSVPMIGLVYDPKIRGYMEYIKQTSVGDVETVKADAIKKMIDNIMKDYSGYKHELHNTIEALKDKSKENARIAIELLKS